MPYPAARENPESTPCVKKLRGSSEGVREAAKNRVPRRRPLVENECHGPLPIWPHLSIPGERQLRPAACRERPDGTSRGREIESIPRPSRSCLGATCSRLFRRAYCHAGYRLHANKVVAHTFNAAHIFGCENKCPTLSLIEDRSPEFHCAVAHDDIDQTERRPTLLFQLCQQALTNRYVIGRCRTDLPGQAGERMKQVGATDDSDELVVTQDQQAFDAVTLRQLYGVTQRRILLDGVNRPSHDVFDPAAA